MVCPPCRKAGELNTRNNQKYDSTRKRRIMAWHTKCPGKDRCDCQHVTGRVLNTQ